jgi:hypothetical protein
VTMPTVVIRGRGWAVERVEDVREYARQHGYDMPADELDGLCLTKEALVFVDSTLRDAHRLEIELHELIHAYDATIAEKRVRHMGRQLSRALWRLGYRLRPATRANRPPAPDRPAIASPAAPRRSARRRSREP